MQFIINRKLTLHGILAVFCTLATVTCASSSHQGSQSPLPSDNQIAQGSSSSQQPSKHHAKSGSRRAKYAPSRNAGSVKNKIGPANGSISTKSETELWLFGIGNPALTTPMGATGVRVVIDLRHLSANKTGKEFKSFADRGLGLALCLRWRNPKSNRKAKVTASGDYDVVPTSREADRAIATLKKLLRSKDAKRIGNRLYIQFYNEVGGGPGYFKPESADQLFAFATRAAAEIRKVNPDIRICGPGFTGTEIQVDQATNSPRAQVIKKAIAWTAKYADVSDLHLHAIDGSTWTKSALAKLRGYLDQTERGKTVGIVSFKWSAADYTDHNNEAGLRNATLGVWKTLADSNVIVAAYSPYWPLRNKASKKMADKFGWVSIIKEDGSRNAPVFDALQEIGGGNGIDEQKSKRSRNVKRKKKHRK